jgi:hypothetical protein
MKKRVWIIAGVVAAVVVGALAVVYLTGLVIVGDPYSGLWNTTGQQVGAQGTSGYLIKRTDDGYVFTAVAGTNENGWRPLQRHGRTLDAKSYGEEFSFAYQPWNGHLAYTYLDHGIVVRLTLKKAPDSSAAAAQVD